ARFCVGVAITEPIRQAILAAKAHGTWAPALDTDGQPREGAPGLRTDRPGLRRRLPARDPVPRAQRRHAPRRPTVPVRHHRWPAPPGDHHRPPDRCPPGGSIQSPEARHRGHARVEDRIRTGKDTGFGRFPPRVFAINAAWLQLALTGIDLLAWTQMLLLHSEL